MLPQGNELGASLHEVLLSTSGALLDALEPLEAAGEILGRLELLLGARRVAWVEVTNGGGQGGGPGGGQGPSAGLARARVRTSRTRATLAELDVSLGFGLSAGEVLRVSCERLARSARCLRQGVRALTLCAAPTLKDGARFLWIESESALAASELELQLAAANAAQVFALASRLDGLAAGEALKRRGVAALAMVHDLRHQLSLGLLCAQRVREAEGADAERSLLELDRALAKARAIAQDALGNTAGADHRVSSTRLRELLQEEAQTVSRLATLEKRGEGRVAIALRCPRGLRVRAAESSLSRLVRNLLLNAYKASSAGSRVLVSAERQEGRVKVCIEDFGRGMDDEKVRELFTSDRTEAGGAGCGTLSILACVDELGAELEVLSTLGKGTRVSILLAEATEEASEPCELPVLLVDGNRERRLQRVKLLEQRGKQVLHVSRASEALFELERALPAYVLVERGLPETQLDQLAARARELETEIRVLDYRDSCANIAD